MRILVLGGDGYLGWPTAMYLSRRGNQVGVLDSLIKRVWEKELNVKSLFPIARLDERVRAWKRVSEQTINLFEVDLCQYEAVESAFKTFQPDAIVHFGEQPSAPFSMISPERSVSTQVNNIAGTLNVLWAMRRVVPEAHLIKLGTMGVYGTPNIDIEEGFLEITHHGRRDVLPFPKQPGSFYHLSKAHDSANLMFACRSWGLAASDLHQGPVYGLATPETEFDERLRTNFHYDHIFGTALNRFCVEAVIDTPITVYGSGHQRRGFISILDTMRCIEMAAMNPARPGECRVMNQFTELFSILELAHRVSKQAGILGFRTSVSYLENPRAEADEHYYNPAHSKLIDMGLEPHLLTDEVLRDMITRVASFAHQVKRETILPQVKWHAPETVKAIPAH